MTNLDDKILNAIAEEHTASNKDYTKELGLFGLIRESFKGSLKWIVVLAFILIFIFIGLTIYCGYNFFYATDMAIKLNWMAAGLATLIITAILRLWYFIELNRIAIKRDVKRVELQVSLLVKKIDVFEK